jgi:hypothetical protein
LDLGRIRGDWSLDGAGRRIRVHDPRQQSSGARGGRGEKHPPVGHPRRSRSGIKSFASKLSEIALFRFDHGFDLATRLLVVVATSGFHGDSSFVAETL